MSSEPPNSLKPGQRLEQKMADMEPHERPLFLDFLERKYRTAGDLEMLREIRAYRALASASPPRRV